MTAEPRGLVGVSWVVKRTGLHRTTIEKAAARGAIPGATKLLGCWRFDPDVIERWIAAGRTTQQTTELAEVRSLSRPAPKPDQHQRGRGPPPQSTPELVVLFPDAPWRGIHDRPAEQPARATASRRRRTTRAGLSR